MKRNFNLKMVSLIFIGAISLNAFAADAGGDDQAKLNSTADQQQACATAKDLQNFFIYYAGDDATLDAQVMAYAQIDAQRQGKALKCVNDLGLAMQSTEASPSFMDKMKARLQSLATTINGMVSKQSPESLRITTPVATIGVRG